MRANILPNQKYYYFSLDVDVIQNHQEVMKVIKRYLEENSNAKSDELESIFKDVEKHKNFVCKFDDYTKMNRNAKEGKRVAYGAFRHRAPVHTVQTGWSYTYEILDVGDQYYMVIDIYHWTPETNLRSEVAKLLE